MKTITVNGKTSDYDTTEVVCRAMDKHNGEGKTKL